MTNLNPEASDVRRQAPNVKEIHVVAGIIYSPDRNNILIARRPDHLHQGGLWEFPGGKVDVGEPARAALDRELEEELGIRPGSAERFHQLRFAYPEKTVFLDFWSVYVFTGDPRGREGQEIAWVPLSEIHQYTFPEANVPVVRQLARMV